MRGRPSHPSGQRAAGGHAHPSACLCLFLLVGFPASATRPRGPPVLSLGAGEALSIQPIDIDFLQRPGEWRVPGHGISLDALGEPKSGTTWLGRLVPQLALDLCGSENNLWCEMGGLVVTNRVPAPSYEFEMLNTTTAGVIDEETGEPGEKTLFLHYKAEEKHTIPGMDMNEPERSQPHGDGCEGEDRDIFHRNGFYDIPPCGRDTNAIATRERLVSCLWSTSKNCVSRMTSHDPSVRRSFVIFRDPREVIVSEQRMRTAVYHKTQTRFTSLDKFVKFKFKTLVSWIHQRWVWHSGDLMQPSSFLVYYEEAQKSHQTLIGMAAFMGLKCTDEQAFRVWKAHENTAPHGDYTTQGLQVDTIEWMNATMARLLPPTLALRYGVTPIYS